MAAADVVVVEHPNRAKAASRATKAVVVALLLVSAALVALVTVGGWEALEGARLLQVAFVVTYVACAALIARWHRGLLPVVAALAIVLGIFAAIAAPAWFDRDRPGLATPAFDSGVLGVLCALLVPLQLLLVAFAAQGFLQAWHVEVERHPEPQPA